ncbi:MAG: PTS sugar transporter subunit IIA [Planctomycetota bacterium]|nr:PTS sugar transporter subunit IIA [Planctomycetota bacterium]
MRLLPLLSETNIYVGLSGESKENVLARLCAITRGQGGCGCDAKALLASILEREKVKSTGVGGGAAIPHARCAAIAGVAVALGIARNGIEFAASDGKPVKIILLVASPEGKETEYLRLISHAAALLKDPGFVEKLAGVTSSAEAISLVEDRESKMPPHPVSTGAGPLK